MGNKPDNSKIKELREKLSNKCDKIDKCLHEEALVNIVKTATKQVKLKELVD